MTRRLFVNKTLFVSGSFILAHNFSFAKDIKTLHKIYPSIMQEESAKHKQTWMAFVANDYIWNEKQINAVKSELILLAKTIAKYETVSILFNKKDKNELITVLNLRNIDQFPIELFEFNIDDLWIRDTGPVFVKDIYGEKAAINFNFNAWGEKQEYFNDKNIADFIIKKSSAKKIISNLVLEGGSFEIDGLGTAILTESSVLNDNRNPNITKEYFEEELKLLLGLKKIIWLKGIKGKDITDAHVDFYARFSNPGTVLVSRDNDKYSYDYNITRENIKILQNSKDARGRYLEIIIIDNANNINDKFGIKDFAASYIGYYLCNNAVIIQEFGDEKADKNAYDIIKNQFPSRTIEQISINAIASGGGSIHCCTQQEPLD